MIDFYFHYFYYTINIISAVNLYIIYLQSMKWNSSFLLDNSLYFFLNIWKSLFLFNTPKLSLKQKKNIGG